MPKIEIEVDQVLTAAVALEIEPGDRVFVMNGLVVGLVERPRLRMPEPMVMSEPAPVGPPAPSPAIRKSFAASKVDNLMVTTVLRDGAATSRAIADQLRLDKAGRYRLKSCLHKLLEQDVIVKADNTRFPAFQLNPRHAPNGVHAA